MAGEGPPVAEAGGGIGGAAATFVAQVAPVHPAAHAQAVPAVSHVPPLRQYTVALQISAPRAAAFTSQLVPTNPAVRVVELTFGAMFVGQAEKPDPVTYVAARPQEACDKL